MSIFSRTPAPKPSGMGGPKNEALTPQGLVKMHMDGAQEVLGLRRNYWITDLFLRGLQWVAFQPATGQIIPLFPQGIADDRARPVVNRMLSSMETIMGRALQRELVFNVIPNAADDDSIQGAKIAESAIRDLQSRQNWERLKEEFARSLKKGGTAAICVDWDPDGGEMIDNGLSTGDVSLNALSITEFVVEPGSRNAETARWWIKAQILPPKVVQAKYNLPYVPKLAIGTSPYSPRLTSQGMGVGAIPEGTLVYTLYERPNPIHPQGQVATVVDDEFVFGPKPWPFPFKDRLNLAVGRDVPQEGRWYGDTPFSQAMPLQTALNFAWAMVIEHNAAIGNARMVLPQSQMNVIEQLSDNPEFPLIVATGEPMPQYLNPPPLPQGAVQQIEMLEKELDDLLGIHDISRGQADNAVQSGYGLSLLMDQDNTPVGKLIKSLAGAFERSATMVLEIYAQNSHTQRKSVVYVPGQPATTVKWTGKNLAGQTKVTVPVDLMLPKNRAASQQFAETAVKMGMIQPGNFAQFARIADLPDRSDLMWAVAGQTAKAQWNAHLLAEGVPCEVEDWFDPEEHIAVINNFRLSPKYDSLPDHNKQLLELYVQACKNLKAQHVADAERYATMHPALGSIAGPGGAPGRPGMGPLGPGMPPQGGMGAPGQGPPNETVGPAPTGAA